MLCERNAAAGASQDKCLSREPEMASGLVGPTWQVIVRLFVDTVVHYAKKFRPLSLFAWLPTTPFSPRSSPCALLLTA
jgi:hypothetical protein